MASLRRRVYIATGVSYKNYRAVRPLLVAPARPESLQEVMVAIRRKTLCISLALCVIGAYALILVGLI